MQIHGKCSFVCFVHSDIWQAVSVICLNDMILEYCAVILDSMISVFHACSLCRYKTIHLFIRPRTVEWLCVVTYVRVVLALINK